MPKRPATPGTWKHVNGSQGLEIDDVNAYDFALDASRKLAGTARRLQGSATSEPPKPPKDRPRLAHQAPAPSRR